MIIVLINMIFKSFMSWITREVDRPSNFPRTLLTAPTQPWHDMPTFSSTTCNRIKVDHSNREISLKINM